MERTTSQRVSKRHSKPTPLRAYEDEKFSFVVLRRGTRPLVSSPLEGLTIEPAEEDDAIEFIEDPFSKDDEEEDDEEEEEDDEEEDDEEEDDEEEEEGEEAVADAGTGWARIVRTPIRRGRRTILDLCAASEKDGSRGEIIRFVCSRRGQASALHPQARKSRWGDLWPC
jgi:ribosomal protein RSM22 (predicted rRNA methylase)